LRKSGRSPPADGTREAAMTDEERRGLQAVYREVEEGLATTGAACRACGACCRFAEHGHEMFLSGLEVEWLLEGTTSGGIDAEERCPFLRNDVCTRRERRALACRVYYCDAGNSQGLTEICERAVSRLKTLHEQSGRPWRYARLSEHLLCRNSGNDKG
jgi:Fe-S-cluster containining protein